MNLRRSIRHPVVIVTAVLWVLGWIFFEVQSNDGALLLSLVLSLAFGAAILASLGKLIRDWGTQRWATVAPLAICVVAIPIAWVAGEQARRLLFAANSPLYEEVVTREDVQALRPGVHIERLRLSPLERRRIEWVAAQRTDGGKLVVEFQTASGFLHHAGYLYTSDELASEESDTQYRWPYQNMLRAHWFEVSN